jgi:hypothetical protein
MKLHIPSFMIGVGVGASGAAIAPRLRPVLLEIATRVFKLADLMVVRVARTREDLSDLLAEAKARARDRLGAHREVA